MLPLDKPTPAVKRAMTAHGISEDDIYIALCLDLNTDGNYGETWLLADKGKMKMYCFSAGDRITEVLLGNHHDNVADLKKKKKNVKGEESDTKDFTGFCEYDLKHTCNMYVDNFVSSNRLLAYDGEPFVRKEELSAAENDKLEEEAYQNYTTISIAFSTNTRKKRLFAFLDVVGRLQNGTEVQDDDPIFEQFNLKCPKCGRVYKEQEHQICEYCSKNGTVMKRLLKYFTDFKKEVIIILACMFFNAIINLISPIVNGKILFDQVITEPDPEAGLGMLHNEYWVFIVVFALIALALINILNNIIQFRATAHLGTNVTCKMKKDIFNAMQKLSLSFYNKHNTGRLMTRVNYDADQISGFFTSGVCNMIYSSLTFIGLTIFLMILNWRLTLIVFIPVPIIVLIFKFMLPNLWRMYTKMWRRQSSLNSMLGDSLNGVRVVKAFAKETSEANRFHKYSERLYEANLEYNKVSLTIFPLISLLIGLSSKAIWGFGGLEVMGKTMTYGEFTTYFGYLGMIFTPLNFFTTFTDLVTQTLNSAQRMYEIIDAVPDITDAPDAVDLDPMQGTVEFKKVNFHYAPNRPILQDITFRLEAGTHLGVVGHTGSGKSTMANLINRLYDVISGSVEIDGVNVRNITSRSLRKNIAIVSQEIYLFRGSVADNIRYAKPDATMDEVIAAAKAANAHQFITGLWDGYETIVGTGGVSLSGGEKQRVSIARALLMDPRILILDEATAAMDTETERQIQNALHVLIKGRTTVTIAHRLSTLRDCDYLMSIDNGKIIEYGTPSELLAAKGLYYRLYTLQCESMKRVLQGM